MRALNYILFLSVISIFLSSCKEEPKKVIKTEPITFTKEGELTITKQKVDTLITKLDIEFAESEYEDSLFAPCLCLLKVACLKSRKVKVHSEWVKKYQMTKANEIAAMFAIIGSYFYIRHIKKKIEAKTSKGFTQILSLE